MGIVEGIGWLALAFGSHNLLPVSKAIDVYNNHFAMKVDRGNSCWDRVSGIEGHYGGPEEFSLDLLCNYRLESYTEEGPVKKWRLYRSAIRSDVVNADDTDRAVDTAGLIRDA